MHLATLFFLSLTGLPRIENAGLGILPVFCDFGFLSSCIIPYTELISQLVDSMRQCPSLCCDRWM
ncbi:hypothetical protein BDD12DRAFT_833580 [Trichophaea hybrida]|nr:hypothetical protein BDD12DRAFT_833580 [Trichophaea hybrida]